jgi:hypothetical protein
MDTPKHLIAIAASKNTAARGNVSSATAKKEERRCGVRVAQRERRYSPKAAMLPDITQVIIPGMSPPEAIAYSRYVISIRISSMYVQKSYQRKREHA